MELATITMPREEAREAFAAYRAEVRARHDDEDRSIMRGYRELAAGRHLIRLSDTMRAGGEEVLRFRRNPRGPARYAEGSLPRLAIARADARYVYTDGIDHDGSIEFRGKPTVHATNRHDVVFLPGSFDENDERPRIAWRYWGSVPTFRAIVPIVPPPLRPAHALSGYHILFEAEWALSSPPAPVDPALLKHIGGDLWAVHAVWDLTELERAVLAGRSEA